MRVSLPAVMLALLLSQPAPSAAQPASPSLDYAFFKTRVQPIFLAKRAGHARCISCHAGATPLRLQPLPAGSATWSEEDSQKNFQAVQRVAFAGNLRKIGRAHV